MQRCCATAHENHHEEFFGVRKLACALVYY